MITSGILILLGAGILAYSGNRLVDFAAAVAEKARLTPAVIGLTVVAAGTSAPELLVSLVASIKGSPGIAIGNVVGSNIANVGLILGLAAVIAPVPVARRVLRFEYPFLLLASWMALLLSRDGSIDRLEAAFFLGSMAGFTGYSVWVARREIGSAEQRLVEEAVPSQAAGLSRRGLPVLLVGLLLSLGGLILGAQRALYTHCGPEGNEAASKRRGSEVGDGDRETGSSRGTPVERGVRRRLAQRGYPTARRLVFAFVLERGRSGLPELQLQSARSG